MPKVEIEIMRTVVITREEGAMVELDVPQAVLDDNDVLSWVAEIMDKDDDGTLTEQDREVYEAVTGAEWDVSDEGETAEYDDAYTVD